MTTGQRPGRPERRAAGGQPREGARPGGAEGTRESRAENRPPAAASPRAAPRAGGASVPTAPTPSSASALTGSLGRGPRSRRGGRAARGSGRRRLTARTPRGPVYARDRAAPAPPRAPGPAPGPAPAPVLAPAPLPPRPRPARGPHADGVPDADRLPGAESPARARLRSAGGPAR